MGLAWYAERGFGDCMGPIDDSLAIAAEAEYIDNAIGEALIHLADAQNAARNEHNGKAREHVQSALDCLAQIVED